MIVLAIIAPIITAYLGYLLGLYDSPTVKIVENKQPHIMADKQYIAVYPKNGIDPAHFTDSEYRVGVERLKKQPEDK